MKIAYCGNFGPAHSTENHIRATLESMGHTVIAIQEDRPGTMIQKFNGCDLFLFTRTWGNTVKQFHLDWLKKEGIPTVSYHLDLYVGLQRDGGIETDPFWRTDYVFTPDGSPVSAEVFKSKGINHHYLKPGVFDQECYIADVPIERDIVFVGSYKHYHPEWPYRKQLVEWLQSTYGYRFQVWGGDGLGPIRGHELNKLYASTKVVVGDSLCPNFTHERYWSDRVTETMGRGGFIIHPWIVGMEDRKEGEMIDGFHLKYYAFEDFDMLKRTIDYYLENDAEREKIRQQGHEFVKANCTYRNRLEEMFKLIGV